MDQEVVQNPITPETCFVPKTHEGRGRRTAVAPGATASLPPPPPAGRPPQGPPTSPWAIVLINRTDLPITVEQRLFR